MNTENKYALTETLKNDSLWKGLLKSKINQAEYVEFNVLYDKTNLSLEIKSLDKYLVETGKRKNKIYSSGDYRRYKLTDEVIRFILSKTYDSWYNYQFEDLSLIKNDKEILATITHENYVLISVSEEERNELNNNGYDFGELFELQGPF